MRSMLVVALAAGVAIVFAAAGSGASVPTVQTRCTPTSGKVRPSRILIACGDGNFYVTSLRWSSWTPTGARGRGTAHQNDCKPYCAAGHFHSYRGITVRLSRPRACKGEEQFRRLSWRYGTAHPSGVVRSGFVRMTCIG
jgi:hypothetical protein